MSCKIPASLFSWPNFSKYFCYWGVFWVYFRFWYESPTCWGCVSRGGGPGQYYESLRKRPSERCLGYWECAPLGGADPTANLVNLCHLTHEVSSLLCPVFPPWCTALFRSRKKGDASYHGTFMNHELRSSWESDPKLTNHITILVKRGYCFLFSMSTMSESPLRKAEVKSAGECRA